MTWDLIDVLGRALAPVPHTFPSASGCCWLGADGCALSHFALIGFIRPEGAVATLRPAATLPLRPPTLLPPPPPPLQPHSPLRSAYVHGDFEAAPLPSPCGSLQHSPDPFLQSYTTHVHRCMLCWSTPGSSSVVILGLHMTHDT